MSGRTLRRMLRSPGFFATGYRDRRYPRLAARYRGTSGLRAAEIAMLIWTTCTGIVQT